MLFRVNDVTMTKEQELRFQAKTRAATGKYFWAAILFVLLFQIYNITYALYYTDFRLESQASRIYMVFYVSMVLICIAFSTAALPHIFSKKQRDSLLIILYAAFFCILLLWSVAVTLYDQRVSDNISIYMTTSIYMAGLIYMSPRVSVPVFILCEGILICGLIWIDFQKLNDTYGACVNSVGVTIVSLFISLYRWNSLRLDFLNQLEIEEKNRTIIEQSEKLIHMANHDSLTGLWNRHYLNEWKENLLSSGAADDAAFFIADIDYFKQYNDAFGHLKGDECLKTVACALRNAGGDVFRFGGEEFLCLHTKISPQEADKLADTLRQSTEALRIESARPGKPLTVSIGYSTGNIKNDADFQRLLREADDALYLAKNSGRNCAVKYVPQN